MPNSKLGSPAPESVLLELTLVPPARIESRAPRAPFEAAAEPTIYRILRTNQMDEYDEPVELEILIARGAERAAPGDNFRGTARRAAKISVADAEIEEFSDLRTLIQSLPSFEGMVRHDPPILVDRESDRVSEEKRNVRVRAFLYAASRENDNDFHLIVGRDPNLSAMYMTMEVSGLPPSSSEHFAVLREARDAYQDFFRNQPDGLPGSSYDFYRPPIPVEVEGSLFFDMSHSTGGRPGPQDLRDDIPTIWEVHPISRIVFEP